MEYRRQRQMCIRDSVREHADKLAVIRSCHADSHAHGSALVQMNTGMPLIGRPSLGAWVAYGLGSESHEMPAFLVLGSKPRSKSANYGSGFLPSQFQGTVLRDAGEPIVNLANPPGVTPGRQRLTIDAINRLNHRRLEATGDDEIRARIASYELAYKMQAAAPEAVDFNQETAHTHELYGLGSKRTEVFGRQCLLARRLVERGVRFVQIYSGGNHNDANWDAHGDLKYNHELHAGETDKPLAGLIQDLKQRGMLNHTLIVWGGEFGRQPTAEYAEGTGRDHNSYCLLYTSPSPRDGLLSRMPSSA